MTSFDVEDALKLRAGKDFEIAGLDPTETPGCDGGKKKLDNALEELADEIGELQEKLFATARVAADDDRVPSVLVVLQGMDTSGKGGAIRHVFSMFDPQGVDTVGFGSPTEEERKHDFLWRIRKHDPEPGRIVAFDRSHYEDVLIQRVHQWVDEEEIDRRFAAIRDYEKQLADGGTRIIKVFFHISKEFQKRNLIERVERPDKYWKYDPADVAERGYWDDYMRAYEDAIRRTDEDHAPWFAIPTDNKRYARLVLALLLLNTLRELDLDWPGADFDPEAELARLKALD